MATLHLPQQSPKGPRQDLADSLASFLHSSAPRLFAGPEHSTGTGTRPPGTFDRHIAPSLRLKHVRRLPGINTVLRGLPEIAIRDNESLPAGPAPPYLDSNVRQATHQRLVKSDIRNETELALYYGRAIAPWVVEVGVALECQLKSWSDASQLVKWSIDPAHSTMYARADGHLRLDRRPASDELKRVWKDSKLGNVRKYFRDMAVYEFKSLAVAKTHPPEALLALSALETFPWQSCTQDDLGCILDHVPQSARGEEEHQNGPLTTGARMGDDVDAENMRKLGLDFVKTDSIYIVQQLWAELAQKDASFGIIHGGVYEIICFRHRAAKTLYLSDIILPADAATQGGYFSIATGFVMAVLREVAQRGLDLDVDKAPWNAFYDMQAPSSRGKALVTTRKPDPKEVYSRPYLVFKLKNAGAGATQFLHQAGKRQCHIVGGARRLRLSKVTREDMLPMTRREMVLLTVDADRPMLRNDAMKVCAAAVSVGKVEYAGGAFVKQSSDQLYIKHLCREADMYQVLSTLGVEGIPTFIGIWSSPEPVPDELDGECDDAKERQAPAVSLVLGHAGEPLTRTTRLPKTCRFEAILGKIHSAGYVHGNLQRGHLLLKDDSAFICSWGNARPETDTVEHVKEMEKLAALIAHSRSTIERSRAADQARTVIFGPLHNEIYHKRGPEDVMRTFKHYGQTLTALPADLFSPYNLKQINATMVQKYTPEVVVTRTYLHVKFSTAIVARRFRDEWSEVREGYGTQQSELPVACLYEEEEESLPEGEIPVG